MRTTGYVQMDWSHGVLLSWRESRFNSDRTKGIYSQGAGADAEWKSLRENMGGERSSSVELLLEIVQGG